MRNLKLQNFTKGEVGKAWYNAGLRGFIKMCKNRGEELITRKNRAPALPVAGTVRAQGCAAVGK